MMLRSRPGMERVNHDASQRVVDCEVEREGACHSTQRPSATPGWHWRPRRDLVFLAGLRVPPVNTSNRASSLIKVGNHLRLGYRRGEVSVFPPARSDAAHCSLLSHSHRVASVRVLALRFAGSACRLTVMLSHARDAKKIFSSAEPFARGEILRECQRIAQAVSSKRVGA